jgi:hypothetical protein
MPDVLNRQELRDAMRALVAARISPIEALAQD